MSDKSSIWIGAIVGSVIGSLVPLLWGAGSLSMSSMVFGSLGAILGIWLMFKYTH